MDMKVALAAPTGRAAKRLSESTSREAKTIHRLLEMGYDPSGKAVFGRNEHELLEHGVIIVDEASMIDVFIMEALLLAIKPGARIVIIGDADQLPSVGAGNVLRDIIESGRFATVRLNEIFRQAQQSLIIMNAHRINTGEMPALDVKDNDFFFMKREGEYSIARTIVELCQTRLPRKYGDMARYGTQVTCPSRKGESGTENLNLLLQAALNPPDVRLREYKFREVVFREGDKVMQTRNNYDLGWTRESDGKEGSGVFNGDIGIIEEINFPDKSMMILFDDRRVCYDFTILEDIEHAYAVTVHKSQGSEYPIVIIPVGNSPQMLLTRNLLYTAVTRAQNMVILVGQEAVVERMVENNRQSMRYTGLCDLLSSDTEVF
jgi:exodeoxyribonuclease V alpha subunit